MEIGSSFGAWVKLRRRALRLTQQELAGLVGCSAELIRKIEADARRPSVAVAERLARFLGMPEHQHGLFIKVARAALRVDWLPAPDAPAAPYVRRHAPPVLLTALIGRSRELAEVRATLLRSDVRLLTLLGPPGVGKTSLSIHVATDLSHAFADGVCFVALAPVSDPAAAPDTIAQALSVQVRGEQPLIDSLKGYLRDRQILLVLDNFEQLLPVAPLIADLLRAAPRVKALVTSRAGLHISGEHEYVVAPLALPDRNTPLSPDALASYPAIELFLQRARAIGPDFVLSEANAAAVAAICARLDGLPLALELAAARIKLFAPEQLLVRLEHRLAFLTGGARDLPPRQQTLRDTIAWSYDLLSADEQRLFRYLGVFAGGCTLAAAEAVCGRWELGVRSWGARATLPTPISHLSSRFLDGLTALVDQSLVRRTEGLGGEPRLTMLETLREYALETLREYALEALVEHGEEQMLRRRHAEYFTVLAEQAEKEFRGPYSRAWMDRLEADFDNLRAALAWSQSAPGMAELGLRLASSLMWFWDQRAMFEGDMWLTKVLSHRDAHGGTLPRAKALVASSFCAFRLIDNDRALALAYAALSLARELGDQALIGWALHKLGMAKVLRNDLAEGAGLLEEGLMVFRLLGDQFGIARTMMDLADAKNGMHQTADSIALLEQSLAIYRSIGDTSGASDSLWILGQFALDQGNISRAIELLEQSLLLCQETGDKWGVANALRRLGLAEMERGDAAHSAILLGQSVVMFREQNEKFQLALAHCNIGDLARLQHDVDHAAACYAAGLWLFEKLNDKFGIATARCKFGFLALSQGDCARAKTLLFESLTLSQDIRKQQCSARCLTGLAGVAAEQGQAQRAARVLAATEVLCESINDRLEAADRACYDQAIAAIHAQLDEASFAAAWAAGRALSVDQAIAEALQDDR